MFRTLSSQAPDIEIAPIFLRIIQRKPIFWNKKETQRTDPKMLFVIFSMLKIWVKIQNLDFTLNGFDIPLHHPLQHVEHNSL